MTDTSTRQWTSQFAFLAAAIGSAVGISNIWKFTYVAGENGGGLFTLVYVVALAAISIPALIAELLIGRTGGRSMVGTMDVLAEKEGISRMWRWYGVMAAVGVFLALSFYCVIAGWTISYIFKSMGAAFHQISAEGSQQTFDNFLASPVEMVFYQFFFLALTAVVVARGIHDGLESVLKLLTPGLFFILIALVVFSSLHGDFQSAFRFMFVPVLQDFSPDVILKAVGQAFFSLGVGLGVLMTVGAYMKQEFSLAKAAVIIATADGAVAILAGLAIFPLVFEYNLSAAGGPGLIFTTLPIAFGQMAGGGWIGPVFFLLLALAAFTSSVTLLEAVVAWLEENTSLSRSKVTLLTAAALWFVGLATVFSFNIWFDFKPMAVFGFFHDKTIFDLIDYLVSNLLMPMGGILVAVLAGWSLSRATVVNQLGIGDGIGFSCWYFLVRYVVPVFVTAVFWVSLFS